MVYSLRVNISVAVVCMLKPINSTEISSYVNGTPPLDAGCGNLEKDASSYDVRKFSYTVDLQWLEHF